MYLIIMVNSGPCLPKLHLLLVPDDRGLFRKHTHSGTAHGFSFQVQFIVREEKVDYVTLCATICLSATLH